MWTNDKVLRLIDLYKSYDYLWDTTNDDYKNKRRKNESWEEIARAMNVPRREIEMKVHSLRSQFIREQKKNKMASESGSVRPSTWFAYGPLMFLTKGESSGTTDSVLKQDLNQDSQSTNDSELENSLIIDASNNETENILYEQNIEIRNRQKQNRKRTHEDNYCLTDDSKKRTDEFDIYGDYIASELRNVKTEHGVIMAKYLINNIILDARMGKLDGEGHGVVGRSSLRDVGSSRSASNDIKASRIRSVQTLNDIDDVVIEVKCEADES